VVLPLLDDQDAACMAAMNRKAGNHARTGKRDDAKDGSLFVLASFRRIRRPALHVADDAARAILR
jgi:hypothetical protein